MWHWRTTCKDCESCDAGIANPAETAAVDLEIVVVGDSKRLGKCSYLSSCLLEGCNEIGCDDAAGDGVLRSIDCVDLYFEIWKFSIFILQR